MIGFFFLLLLLVRVRIKKNRKEITNTYTCKRRKIETLIQTEWKTGPRKSLRGICIFRAEGSECASPTRVEEEEEDEELELDFAKHPLSI